MVTNKRQNKFPNNRFANNVQRTKKITPHTRKEITNKLNRNGFVRETIPANERHQITTPDKSNFFKDMFFKTGYFNYLWIPFVILLITIILDFCLQFAIYSNINPYYVTFAKNSLFFMTFSIVLFCVNIASVIYMGLGTAKHNVKFKVAWLRIFKIIFLIFIVESILTVIAYLTFLSPFMTQMFATESIRSMYLIYLIAWNMIKAVLYMLMMSLSYLFFFKLKFV
ncbi:MAG: hypothetical protein WCX82_02275 [archaeon]|jgi:hypothetical protein